MFFDRRDALKAFAFTPLFLAGRAFAAPDKTAADAEAERVKVIDLVQPAVAAVCFYGGKVCGSGVVITDDGYCLTNHHVVQPTGTVLQCGLANGQLYDSVLVGQDTMGDVALVKLLPKKEGDKFPFVKLGDSDKVQVGDWSLAMGNPFGLALDFTPTVTYGLISGVNRYEKYGSDVNVSEYTDCLQFDTSINPGNSGGPLFNMKGELIGINGRGSFEKRGRVNSGVGYAISMNQIKNFLWHMRAGIDCDHATLGAAVSTEGEESGSVLSRAMVTQILEEADAFRRGVKPGDQLITFAGRRVDSTNQYKNVLGIYPKEWRLPLKYKVGGQGAQKETLVRLMANLNKVKGEGEEQPGGPAPKPGQPRPGPQPAPDPGAAKAGKSPAQKLYKAKKGYANFYFNELETKRLLEAFKKAHGDGTAYTGDWKADGEIKLADGRTGELKLEWVDDKDGFTEVKLTRGNIAPDTLKPLGREIVPADRFLPQGSGGLLAALYQYKVFFSKLNAAGGFKSNDSINPGFTHGGAEPVYPIGDDMKLRSGDDLTKSRIDCEVIRTAVENYTTKWFFHPKDATLVGFESSFNKDEDPCEVYAYDHKAVHEVNLPHKLVARWGDKVYCTLTIKSYTLGKK
jgi:serine protease Do